MKRLLLIFTLFNIGVASAQLKTYNGSFEDGSANYTYKEDGLTRIFEGNFSYKSADGKKSMSGRYTDDMKTGLWKTDWYGFHEETNYKQGLKHGIYKVRYKNSNNEMKIDAHFTQGELDSLSFWMQTPDGRVIGGSQYNSQGTIDTWLRGIDGKYIRTQYFYKGIYVGYTDYDYSTGDWGETTIDDIREVAKFTDSLAKYNYQYAGQYYCLQPQKENKFYEQLTQNGDIFSTEPYWFNEIAYFFIYNFHMACFGSSLWRGEVLDNDYTLCLMMKEDEIRMKAEKERIEKEKANKERKEKNYTDAIAKQTAEFNQTEYGKLINYLKPYAEKSDNLFEQAKHDYIRTYLSQYRLALRPINLANKSQDSSIVSLNFKYSMGDMDSYNCKFISQTYNITNHKGLKDFSVLIIPIALVLNNEQWAVSDAIIIYYHNGANKGGDLHQADLYLQHFYNELRLGTNGYLAKGTRISITDDYVFTSYMENYAMKPIAQDTKYKKSQIYYDTWHNPELSMEAFIRSLTKEEVTTPIEVRFNIKKEE
ncbi:hypothetical protein [uncultured Alistipes sp.]|jgi:hypothetical protein|uniref:hypothetical protein n=1 Tax=uncultured Alistipes sp. TaxID=538949 RepID=UPI0025965B30|nr:hypothetical protein [uncultured Alistipes sp.]